MCLLSFLLVFWAIKHDYISTEDDKANLKKFKQAYKQDKSAHNVNPIHQKWLFFGGGFYGLMAFITYIHVEVIEVYDFVASYTTFANFIDQITIGALLGLIYDSLINLIEAFVWFTYWDDHIDMKNPWYWLLAAYFGYQAGTNLAQRWVKSNGLVLPWAVKNKE